MTAEELAAHLAEALRTLCDALDVNCGTATAPQERQSARAALSEYEATPMKPKPMVWG